MTDWSEAKVRELMKFLEQEVNVTADGMFRDERPRRQAEYIKMWRMIFSRMKEKELIIDNLEKAEIKYDDNMNYWLKEK